MGDELRREYGGFGADRLMTALKKRRKAVLVSHQACRTWCAQYGTKDVPAGSGAGSSSDPTVGRILKRPAAACATVSATPLKRQAAAASGVPTVSSSGASSSSSAPPRITSPAELEAACGKRYRAEVSDKGIGQTWGQLKQKVSSWGYNAARDACARWLSRYRLGGGGRTAAFLCMHCHDKSYRGGIMWTVLLVLLCVRSIWRSAECMPKQVI